MRIKLFPSWSRAVFRGSRRAGTLLGFAGVLVVASCGDTATQPPAPGKGGSGGSGGVVGGGAPAGGGGSAGSATGGTPPIAGTAGSLGGTAGSGGLGGGGGSAVGVPCSTAAGVVTANLTVKRPEIGAREIGGIPNGTLRITHDPVSGTFLISTQGGDILSLDVTNGTTADASAGFPGNGEIRGMKFAPDGTLYVLTIGGFSATIHKKVGGNWSTLLTTEAYPGPAGNLSNYGHNFSNMVISADSSTLYFASGSRTDHGEDSGGQREQPITSAVFSVPTSSSDLNLPNDEGGLATYLYADGLRNSFSLAFNHLGELFGIDNGPDIDLPDEINFIQQGKHYGFPWRMGDQDNPVRDPAYTPDGDMRLHQQLQAVGAGTYVYDAGFPAPPAGVTFTDPIKNKGPDADKIILGKPGPVMDASDSATPFYGISAHRSPLGLVFDDTSMMCGDYYNAGFFVSYGAVTDVMGDIGQDLVMMHGLTKVGDAYEANFTQLVQGFTDFPSDAVMVDNKIYIVTYNNGSAYEITLPLPL